ncbi:MAG: hypothetical protein N3B01_11410 [Verrucomicrobiae bacterium]|nr:hypothetical protein [Verrucomicrobiae bacterium]
MGKGHHVVGFATLVLALWLGACATQSPITGRRMVNLAIEPEDNVFFVMRKDDDLRYGRYLLVEKFPNPASVIPGMPSRTAFELLGKATGVSLDLSSSPPAEEAMKADRDVMVQWRTTAYWSWAKRHDPNRIETADVAVTFVKVTRTKDEIPFVGSPLFRGLDQGWFVEQVNVLPLMHNLKEIAKQKQRETAR